MLCLFRSPARTISKRCCGRLDIRVLVEHVFARSKKQDQVDFEQSGG